LSIIGSNDAGVLISEREGAIITALMNEHFDKIILIWNENLKAAIPYGRVCSHVKTTALKSGLVKEAESFELRLKDVTDHNEIYVALKNFCDGLSDKNSADYTISISSGTPAMQVCWILLAESGEFSLNKPPSLIRVKDPRFGKSVNIPVKLSSLLPKIVSMQNETAELKKLLPKVMINLQKGQLKIGENIVGLSPVEFCYYRYFAERVLKGVGHEKFSGFFLSMEFMQKIFEFHETSFPDLDLNREELRQAIKKGDNLSISTLRAGLSRLNKKITDTLGKDLAQYYLILSEGRRGAKFYRINVSPDTIDIF